jgi:urease beta subunit
VLGAAAFAVLASACADEPLATRGGSVTLVTDARFYTALRTGDVIPTDRFEMDIVVALANMTDRSVTLQACGSEGSSPRFAVSMAAIPNDWSAAYESAFSCGSASSMTLEPGESRVDRVVLSGPRTYDAVTGEALGDLEGEMRLVYYVDGRTLWSNAFTVSVEAQRPPITVR